jgi:hypothetical protein
MQENSAAPVAQDSFVLASHALNVLAAYRRWGGSADDFLAAFAGLVASRNKQIAAECLTALEEAILAVDET